MPPALYTSGEVAQRLKRSVYWFYEHRESLHAQGLPQPLELPGHPRWSVAQVEAWLAQIDLRAVTKRPPLAAANDPAPAAPVTAADAEHWNDYLRQVYAS